MKTTNEITSVWQGSIATVSHVAEQIAERFGADAAKIYDPLVNCFTYVRWQQEGYQVKKGEKALKSITWVKGEKEKDGQTQSFKFPKTVNLFFITQVEPIKKESDEKQG